MEKQADTYQSISKVRDYISTHFGIHYPRTRLAELSHKLESISARMGYDETADCIDTLLTGHMADDRLNQLIENITVGETYFFREPEAIEAIATTIIPAIVKRGERRLRIWVAGCATGEEAYTVAMLLHSRLPGLSDWSISILATDLNSAFLARAVKASYGSWSFRAIPSHYMSRYFTRRSDECFEVEETIRRMVRFENINLVNGHFPSPLNGTEDCDLILCRNVLMYFAPETIRAITARLARSLVCNGWLIVSQTECGDYFTTCFDTVQAGNIFLYRKKNTPDTPASRLIGTGEPEAALPARFHGAPLPLFATFPSANRDIPATHGLKPDRETLSPAPEPPDHEESFRQAQCLADEGKLDEARLRCEEGLAANSLSFHGQYLHAVILQELEQWDDAHDALRRVLYLNPDFVMAIYMLGNIAHKRGNPREALMYFDKTARMLANYDDDHLLPEAEGLTVGHLKEFIDARRKA